MIITYDGLAALQIAARAAAEMEQLYRWRRLAELRAIGELRRLEYRRSVVVST